MEIAALLGIGAAAAGGTAAVAAPTVLAAGTIPTVAATLPTLATVGTGLAAAGTLYSGIHASQVAKYEATQLKSKAADETAIAQREAMRRRHEADLLASRARAVAGAGGGYVTDPSVTAIMANIHRQGEYNALSELAMGSQASAALRSQAAIRKKEGSTAMIGAALDAGGTAFDEAARRRLYR